MMHVPMPQVAIVHFPDLPHEAYLAFQELTDAEAEAEKEHIVLSLVYAPREKPSYAGMDDEAIDVEEDHWWADHSHAVAYRLTWRDTEGALFNLNHVVLPSPTVCFPVWYESFCTRLTEYVNGYLFDQPHRLEAYETRAPAKLGGLIVNCSVLETPAEIGARARITAQQLQQGDIAIQPDFFMDRITPVFYVTP